MPSGELRRRRRSPHAPPGTYNQPLTLEGELNKLAWNIAFGRAFAGVHYRSDLEAGLLLGESIALKLLSNLRRGSFDKSTLWFRRFDGNWTSVKT